MRKHLFITVFLFTLLASSCGKTTPTITPDSLPPASFSEPQAGTPPTNIFFPNPIYGKNIRFEQFSLEDGLSQSSVNVILQDHMGFLWLGTQDGLNRYDGYNFKVYKPNEDDLSNSLSDRWITALAEDSQGYLWVGTRLGGLNRYNPVTGKFEHYLHSKTDSESLGNNQISSLLSDEKGLWIGTDYGLDFLNYETGKFSHYRASPENLSSLSSNLITAIFKDSSGLLWIGTKNAGVNAYDEKNNSFQTYKYDEEDATSLSNNRVLSIAEGKNGNLWVGTASGLNRFEVAGKYFTPFTNSKDNPDSLGGNSIFTIYKDRSGGLWIGTNNGLDRYDETDGKFIHYQNQAGIPNTISNNLVHSIYEDNNNILWVGTYGGLNKYNRQQDKFAYYRNNPDDPNSLSSNHILPITVDSTGIVWIGTNSGLERFDPVLNQFSHYQHDLTNEQSLSSDDVITLHIDHKGILWVGTIRGLDQLDPATGIFTHFQLDTNNPNSISNLPVYAIYQDSAMKLWLGTERGLYQFNDLDNTITPYDPPKNDTGGFVGNQINVIFEDSAHSLWVGTFDDGLIRINPTKSNVTQYKNDPENTTSLGNDSIMSIYQDINGTLWIGTAGGGLNRYNPETDSFTRYTEKDGLPNNVVYGILEDEAGNLWISTNFGLSRFNPKSLTFRNFTASDGLQSNEFNQNAFAKDQQGNLYFGGINGLNIFLPKDIKDLLQPPNVALTTLTQDGTLLNLERTTEYLREITLSWPQDSFEFEFTAFAYGQPSKNQYAYILEGFDRGWQNIGSRRNGRYTNLPGGTYTLRLRGSNSDGIWNEQGQAIRVTVVPPFWETWWFRSSLLFVLVATIASGYRWRVKSMEGRNRELERLVQRRTSDLEKRTSEIEALYQADERILRNVTLIQVFQTLVDVSVSMLKADRSVVFVWSSERNKILPRVSHGFRPETLFALNFDEGEGLVGQTMLTGEPVIVSDVKLEKLRGDIQTVIRNEGIQSFAHFPIVVDGIVIAVFNVAYTRPNALNEGTVRLFSALVTRATLSIANMQLFEQTKDLAVMEERNRLARDLHDSAKQKAFAALAQLGTANGILETKPEEVKPHLNEAETLVYEVIQELTFLIQEIYPIALQEKGLPATLREYVFEWENRNDAVINLTIQNERRLPLDVEQAIYRLIQEALANVSRHSKAKQVDISLVYNTDSLQATVADNGYGFDMNQKAKGMGFRSMRERIGGIRGTIQIQSAPGQGTRVIAQLPLKS